MIDGNSIHFLEIYYPELVNDIRHEFDYINSIGQFKHSGINLKTILFDANREEFKNLDYLFKKYDFLKTHILLFNFEPGSKSPIHKDSVGSDGGRIVSINIPIEGCTEDCITEFFDIDNKFMYEPDGARSALIRPDAFNEGLVVKKISQYSLIENPVLVDTQTPHRINNKSTDTSRISLSWTTKFTSWQSALDYFESKRIIP